MKKSANVIINEKLSNLSKTNEKQRLELVNILYNVKNIKFTEEQNKELLYLIEKQNLQYETLIEIKSIASLIKDKSSAIDIIEKLAILERLTLLLQDQLIVFGSSIGIDLIDDLFYSETFEQMMGSKDNVKKQLSIDNNVNKEEINKTYQKLYKKKK